MSERREAQKRRREREKTCQPQNASPGHMNMGGEFSLIYIDEEKKKDYY